MARIVCQVLHRADRITFIWSDGQAFFEPYHLAGEERAKLLAAAAQIQAQLADATLSPQIGHALYRAVFRMDDADRASASAVQSWLNGVAIDSIEFVTDAPGVIPWTALTDDPASDVSRCWGARFALGAGRRVNILRQSPFQTTPVQLMAADSDLVDALNDSHRPALGRQREAGKFVQTRTELTDELRKQAPDVLFLFVRFENGQLKLGADPFSAADLQDWLDEPREGNPDPLILLVGCGDRAEQAAWQAVIKDASSRFGGLIANEILLTPSRAFTVGQAIAQRFVEGTQSIGQILQNLRTELGADAMIFAAYCPPELRVANDGASPPPLVAAPTLPLPALPYRPFAAYEESDRALFFGREDDTLRGALLLDDNATCGVFLHGGPASGKTSYLQAGLLPFLEHECIGYRVLRDRNPSESAATEKDFPTLVLRTTNDLAGQLADALASFCAQPYHYTTPAGAQVTVDLPRVLKQAAGGMALPATTSTASTAIQSGDNASAITTTPDAPGAADDALAPEELWIAIRDNPPQLARILEAITAALPFELVIAIDQGEDLVTLVRTAQQRERRTKALKMLMALASSSARCKIIYAVRSQYLGQLVSFLPNEKTPPGWTTHYLPPLPERAMVDALLWPTNRDEIPYAREIPSSKYRFSFEEGMAQQVVADAVESAAGDLQSPLALVQAIGALLYEKKVLGKNQNTLRMADVKDVGGVRGSTMKCLENSLEKLKLSSAAQRSLRQLVAKLSACHADGTVSRDLVPASDLKSHWTAPSEPVEAAVNKATDVAGLFDIQQLMIGGKSDVYVSLPQDSLAQLGRKIEGEKELRAFGRSRIVDTLWIMIPFAFLVGALTWYGTKSFATSTPPDEEDTKAARVALAKEFRLHYATNIRPPLYGGLLARADQAIRSDNALRARQILREEPASRNINEESKEFGDIRGFDWRYLWKQLHSERHHLQGHRAGISAIAVTRDGKRAASVSQRGDQADDDAAIRIWNLETGEELARIRGPKSPPLSAAFSPDGKTLAVGFADKLIRLWDVSGLKTDFVKLDKESKTLEGHEGAVQALAFGKDDLTLISAGADKAVIVWDVAQAKQKATHKEHTAAITALAITSDGKTLASAGADGQLILSDADSGKKRQAITTPLRSISALSVSPDDKTFAVAGSQTKLGTDIGTVRFFGVSDGKETQSAIEHSSNVHSVAYRPNGESVATGGQDFIVRLWNLKNSTLERKWIGHLGAVTALAFTKDAGAIVSGSMDAQVKVWNAEQSSSPDVIRAHDDWVQCLALSPRGNLLASGARDGTVKVWHTATGKLAAIVGKQTGAVTSVAFSANLDKTILAVGTRDDKNEGDITIWEMDADLKKESKPQAKHTLKGHKKGVTSLAFHPHEENAKILVSGGADASVIVWDADAGKEIKSHQSHKSEVRCVSFFPDGHVFASGDKDGDIRLYDLDHHDMWTLDHAHQGSIEAIAHVRELGRGRDQIAHGLFTASGDHTSLLWAYVKEAPGKLPAQRFSPITYRFHNQPLTSIVVYNESGDRRLAATGSWDGTIKLFELDGNERFTFQGHTGAVRALVIARDRSFMASASNDGTIRIWRADTPGAAARKQK